MFYIEYFVCFQNHICVSRDEKHLTTHDIGIRNIKFLITTYEDQRKIY
jgi:hypothetical protein